MPGSIEIIHSASAFLSNLVPLSLRLGVLQGLMPSDVEVNLQPEELEGLDEAGIKALYEEKVAEARAANRHEDLSDMVRQNAAAQKRKLAQKSDDKASKKTKESFKF
jgi:splicing factor 3B subunit 2